MIMMMSKIITSLFLFVLLFNISFTGSVFAAEGTSSSQAATVLEDENISNVVDRLFEKISMIFKFSSKDKVDYQKKLTEKRLAELKYAIQNDRGELIEELSSRYSTYLGNLTEMVIKNNMTDRKQEFLDMYDRHYQVVDQLDTRFESNSGFWLLMEHNKNYARIYSDQIKAIK